jgi:hypothetical protein
MSLEFAQVVAQLVEAVISLGSMESGEHGLMDLLGGPTADVSAAVQKRGAIRSAWSAAAAIWV